MRLCSLCWVGLYLGDELAKELAAAVETLELVIVLDKTEGTSLGVAVRAIDCQTLLLASEICLV